MINLSDKYLLMIEPDKEGLPTEPIEDEWTQVAERLLKMSTITIVYQSNNHITECGRSSDNCQRELPNGMTVNSLMAYYLRCYRKFVPQSELIKFKQVADNLLRLPKDYLQINVIKEKKQEVVTEIDEMPKIKKTIKEESKEEPFTLEDRMEQLKKIGTDTILPKRVPRKPK